MYLLRGGNVALLFQDKYYKLMKMKLFLEGLKQSFGKILIDFISLSASIVTICLAYFKDHSFSPDIILDWIVIIVMVLAVVLFACRMYKTLWKWEKLILPKKIFFEYVAYQASNASNEIKSIAGDLSWLDSQKDTYFSLAKKQNLRIAIYYSADKVSKNNNTNSLIKEYKNNGIEMFSYPSDIQLRHVKGMLIDNDENARFISFTKVNEGESILCTRYNYGTNEYYIASAFVDCVGRYITLKAKNEDLSNRTKKKVFIGVSGINNIGKTTLCSALKQKYNNSDIAIIQDPFISEAKKSTFEVSLFCLLNQMLDYQRIKEEKSNNSIFIFDRTPIDNFAFLIHYQTTNEYDRYIEHLKGEIKKFMESFDAIVLLSPDKGYRWKKTRYLNVDVRKKIPNNISSLYREIYSDKVIRYKLQRYNKEKDFKLRIKEIVDDFSKRIQDKIQ